jgi:hypothetical protein
MPWLHTAGMVYGAYLGYPGGDVQRRMLQCLIFFGEQYRDALTEQIK